MQTFVTLLCGVGLYVAVFMLRKSYRAARGLLSEPSVVQTDRASLFGAPNAAVGIVYYIMLALAVWFGRGSAVSVVVGVATTLAALTSVYLAYSLLCVTKRSCPYCWTGHAINWVLAVSCVWGAAHGLLFSTP